MVDKKEFERMRKSLESSEAMHEEAFKMSREVVKPSKTVIYSVHRKENADSAVKEMSAKLKELRKNIKPEFVSQLRIAEQEFTEAMCLYGFAKSGIIPTAKELGVSDEHYLLGICDLSGELVRLAINSAINGDKALAVKIKDFDEGLYDELMQFDFSNGELRRKFDSIKYDVKKLEELVLQLK